MKINFVFTILCFLKNGFGFPHSQQNVHESDTPLENEQVKANFVTENEYSYSANDYFTAITSEFVFNVAGDHILFQVPEYNDDMKLHTKATIMAELLQKLYVMDKVYDILNDTKYEIANSAWVMNTEKKTLVIKVLDKAIEKLIQDPILKEEYFKEKNKLENQILQLPRLHGIYASTSPLSLYEINQEQISRAEKLLDNPLVKKLIMALTVLKASGYDFQTTPQVRDNMKLSKAMLKLAQRADLRDRLQQIFDKSLNECVNQFSVLDTVDDSFIFETIKNNLKQDPVLDLTVKIEIS